MGAVARANGLYQDKTAWANMQRAGMKADFSWDRSAARYAALFRRLIAERAMAMRSADAAA
jgi:starch synthase